MRALIPVIVALLIVACWAVLFGMAAHAAERSDGRE